MPEDMLTRITKYDKYLSSQIDEQRALARCENLAGRDLARAKEHALIAAKNELHSLIPELRAPEGKLAAKTQE